MSRPLIVLGTTNLDIVFYSQNLPTVGQSLMGNIAEFGGGKGANQAVAAARLGANPQFATLLGDDEAGQVLTNGLAELGVQTTKVWQRPGLASGKALIFVSENGANMIGIDAGANEHFDADDVARALQDVPHEAVILVEMGLPVAACRAAFKAKGSRFLIFNPAPVREPLLDADCRAIDILTPNESEARELTGLPINSTEEAFDAATLLHHRGIGGVAITLGSQGVVYVDATCRIHQPAFPVDPVDTTAAGDAFNGGLGAALSVGMKIEDALRYAVAAASLSVTRKGAQQSMPTDQEVIGFLAESGVQ